MTDVIEERVGVLLDDAISALTGAQRVVLDGRAWCILETEAVREVGDALVELARIALAPVEIP